jgi:stage V sporulation protein B
MKNKLYKTTLILIIGSFITKILSMIIKIVMSRLLGTKALSLYMLILPTFNLLIGLGQLGFPLALSKLISEDNKSTKKLILSITPLILITNLILMILVILLAPYISNNLLKNNQLTLAIISISLVIPFTTISSLIRSYYFGKNKMFPHILSNIIENIIRLILIISFTKYFIIKNIKYTLSFIILLNIISELSSIIILLLFLPKNIIIKKEDFVPNKYYLKDSLNISIPNTISRLIGSISYFLEPIILTNTLLKNNYSNNYITTNYGIISGYVIPLVLLPSFITSAISSALLPIISKEYINNNIKEVKEKLKEAIILSLIICIPYTIILEIKPSIFLNVIYNTNLGINYIRLIAPICLLEYIEYPLSITLDALYKSNKNMQISLISSLLRCTLLYILSNLKIGIYSLLISTSITIIITTLMTIKEVKNLLK